MMTTFAFQPEAVEALAAAFRKAWRFVSRDRYFAAVDEALLKRRLAACLMRLFAEGEHDPLRLANSAVRRMRQGSRRCAETNDLKRALASYKALAAH
jgi:hypothetical protein